MVAALTPEQEQQVFVTEEITRRIAAQELVTSANLRDAVADSAEASRQQLLIEKTIIDESSKAFETRITDTIVNKVDDRLGVITAQFTGQFVAENEAMRATIENSKGVLEAIGGERFQEVSQKLAALDATQLGYVQMLSAMLNAEAAAFRAESVKHGLALHDLYHQLRADEGVPGALTSGPRPETGTSGSRLRVPEPSGWNLDVLKGCDEGFALWRESFDLQAGASGPATRRSSSISACRRR